MIVKRFLAVAFLLVALSGCRQKISFTGEPVEVRGAFMYQGDSIKVLETEEGNFLMVVGDEMSEKLVQQVKGYQKKSSDWVPVYIKAKKAPREIDAETWDTIIKVTDIIAVMHPEGYDEQNGKIQIR